MPIVDRNRPADQSHRAFIGFFQRGEFLPFISARQTHDSFRIPITAQGHE
jgi:hypothetical protein